MPLNIFSKKKIQPDQYKSSRELLRENLNLLSTDIFYTDDPILGLNKEERIMYLKTFFDIQKDTKLMNRIKYHINKQAIKTLENAKNGIEDMSGAMNINGMAFIKDDIEGLSKMYVRETTPIAEIPLDKFQIIPTVDEGI